MLQEFLSENISGSIISTNQMLYDIVSRWLLIQKKGGLKNMKFNNKLIQISELIWTNVYFYTQ